MISFNEIGKILWIWVLFEVSCLKLAMQLDLFFLLLYQINVPSTHLTLDSGMKCLQMPLVMQGSYFASAGALQFKKLQSLPLILISRGGLD